MSSEERVKAELCACSFSGCLVTGDAEQNARERKIKRRAIVISIVLQSAALAVFVIAPLFAKPAELTERIVVPVPPYSHSVAHRQTNPNPQPPAGQRCVFCPGTTIRPTKGRVAGTYAIVDEAIDFPGFPDTNQNRNAVNVFDSRQPPLPPETREKKRIHESHIDPALLTRRIEPVFPSLARQIRKSGKVELHAVIGTDGSVQALDVVSGDPLFVSSALEAVRQWHYRPTYLNGQPVEIDTFITVIYTLQ